MDKAQTQRVDRHGHIIRPGRPTVRTVFQLSALLRPVSSGVDDCWKRAIRISVDWLVRKFPEPLPPEASEGGSFELEVHGQSAAAISLAQPALWSARIALPDAPFQDAPAVAGRSWTTEVAFSREDAGIRAAVRNICASLPSSDAPIAPTTPVIVADLADNLGLVEVRPLDGKPWVVRAEQDLKDLHALLEDPQRGIPVYLLVQADLDAEKLARRMLGLAHVVVMAGELVPSWDARVGREWSAEPGSVRAYHAPLRLFEDAPYAHPVFTREKIAWWRRDDQEGPAAFAASLVEQAYEHGAIRKVHWGNCLFFADARARQAEIQRAAARDDQEWRSAYEAEIAALKTRLDETVREAESFNDDAIAANRERDLYREDAASLRMHNDALRVALAAKTGQAADASLEIPTTYEALPEWVERHLVGRLILHPRAKRGLRDADYEDPELVYRALMLLANEFRDMRRGNPTARPQLEARLEQLGLHLSRSITPSRAAQEGDEYYVKYPLGTDKTAFFELHLRKGNSKKTRYCLAIYFFWDDQTEQVVVGWLPSHLDNRMT